MRVLLLTPTLSGNSLGRTYCLHLLAHDLGWHAETWSTEGNGVWGPLADDPFAQTCHRTAQAGAGGLPELIERAPGFDLMIAVKPVVQSLGLAWQVHRATGVPLVSDIDDPDLEVLVAAGAPLKALAKRVLRSGVVASAREMRGISHRVPRVVSNPELQRLHGGEVIPHVRQIEPRISSAGHPDGIGVAFVGSVQPHKGIRVLRRAIDQLAPEGFHLTITAPPPKDSRAHERWVGRTSLAQGLALVEAADIVAIPSLSTPWSRGQLPVKVVDAMLLGAGVVVSDIAPLPWAVGPAGVVVRPGRVDDLVAGLRSLRSRDIRAERSGHLQQLAQQRYTVAANREVFRRLCVEAASSR